MVMVTVIVGLTMCLRKHLLNHKEVTLTSSEGVLGIVCGGTPQKQRWAGRQQGVQEVLNSWEESGRGGEGNGQSFPLRTGFYGRAQSGTKGQDQNINREKYD